MGMTGIAKVNLLVRRSVYAPQRWLALPERIRHCSLTTPRDKRVKIGAKVVRHAGYITFQWAEVAVP
jgi:hypothetical protein